MSENGFLKFIQGFVHVNIKPPKEFVNKDNTKLKNYSAMVVGENNMKFLKRYCMYFKQETDHLLSTYLTFKVMNVVDQYFSVHQLRVCLNCLRKKCAQQVTFLLNDNAPSPFQGMECIYSVAVIVGNTGQSFFIRISKHSTRMRT